MGGVDPAPRRKLARKRFGQHFLHDPAVIARIVTALTVRPGDALVEIGPGRGALTRRLLDSPAASLDAIEIDRDLAQLLERELPPREGFTLHKGDALSVDFEALAQQRGRPLRVIGNLPYNISTPLLFHLLVPRNGPATSLIDLHVMLQREVAARIAAQPGDDSYGRLTVMLAPWVQVEWLFDVGPGAFQPPPKVWSSVLRLTLMRPTAFRVSPDYARVVGAAFAQRRKTLRNGLKGLLSADAIAACGVDPLARPETLAPQQWNTLAESLDRQPGEAGPSGGS
jgi:16S rRNA (adenine1518-N6/adenine1519-N6)-dimethyltransferase